MIPPTIQNNIPPNDNHERVRQQQHQQPEPVQEQQQVLPLRCLWKPTTIGVPVIVDDTTTTTTTTTTTEENSTRCTTLDSIETTTIPIPLLLLSNYDDIYHYYCIQQHSISFNLEMNHHHSDTNRTTHQRPTVLPPRHSLFRSIAHALLVVQEFILVTYFGAWYRIILLTTTTTTTTSTTPSIWNHDTTQQQQQQQFYIDISMISMYIALLLAVLCNARATSVMETLPKSPSTTKTSYPPYNYYYYSKVLYRLIDATILAGLVRYIAVVLRNLTASYSTDTVERLAVGAMFVHVLCCDYTYANGYNENTTTAYRRRRRKLQQPPPPPQQQRTTNFNSHAPAPNISTHNATKISSTFMGGTISLNAAFFATIVLVSRFDCNTTTTTIIQTSTTNTTFIFLSLAVILFAFYPVTRHTISIVYPSHQSVIHWCITSAAAISTQSLLFVLDDQQQQLNSLNHISQQQQFSYTTLFWIMVVSLGVLIPIWKRHLAKYKVILRGPWDIPTKDVMELDFKLYL